MALTESNMLSLGTAAPEFELLDVVSSETKSSKALFSDKATVVMFICNHCPFVIHVNDSLVKIANQYLEKDVSFIAISSNDVEHYPQDGPEKMATLAAELSYPFPYLYDETQEVAKAYDAACTPDFYIFDGNKKLAYRGRMDASRPGNGIENDGADLIDALDTILQNKEVTTSQYPSAGCNIKWKK